MVTKSLSVEVILRRYLDWEGFVLGWEGVGGGGVGGTSCLF